MEEAAQMNKVWTLFQTKNVLRKLGKMKTVRIDPWATMIDDSKATVRPEYDEFMKTLQMDGQEESAAKQKAFENVLPELNNLRWMKAFKNDPVLRKIMESKETFANEDSFDSDEALSEGSFC
jgi:hypothetical protein